MQEEGHRTIGFKQVLKVISMQLNLLKHCDRQVLDMLNQLSLSKLYYSRKATDYMNTFITHINSEIEIQMKFSYKL